MRSCSIQHDPPLRIPELDIEIDIDEISIIKDIDGIDISMHNNETKVT